jgi:hypothetical protein
MDIENIVTPAAWVVVVGAIAGPTIYRLIKRAYLIRQHKKNLPGPLLGVVYPKTKDKNK